MKYCTNCFTKLYS